jgi:hypothetical protein
MKRASALIVAFALLSGAFPAGVFAAARQQTGQVSGVVKTEGGQTVPGYSIRIRNSGTGNVLGTGISGDQGQFLFINLPPGAYVVEAVDQQGRVPAVSGLLSIETGRLSYSDVPVILPGDDPAALTQPGGGNFFTSTKGLVIMAAALAAAGAGVVAYQNDKKPKSKKKDK